MMMGGVLVVNDEIRSKGKIGMVMVMQLYRVLTGRATASRQHSEVRVAYFYFPVAPKKSGPETEVWYQYSSVGGR